MKNYARWGLVVGAAVLLLVIVNRSRKQSDGVLEIGEVRGLYDRLAPYYDIATTVYRWIGGYRLADTAIESLNLQPGDTVVDLGTGTGRNLVPLADAVGPSGRVIGVDVSPAMLAEAAIRTEGIQNVELIEADIASYRPPEETRAIISTFAMEMLPDYETVIGRLTKEMPHDGRIATVGLRHPARWPAWLVRIGSALNRPFGVSRDYRSHRPWEAIQRFSTDTIYVEAFVGAIYLAAGTTVRPSDRDEHKCGAAGVDIS